MIKLIDNAESKWDSFEYTVECPSCGDNQGHAGLFPHPFNPELPGIFGHCVKCGDSFSDQERYKATKQELKALGINPSVLTQSGRSYKSPRKVIHKTARVYIGMLRQHNPFYITETKNVLEARNYPPDLINWLINHRKVIYTRAVSLKDQKDWVCVNGAVSAPYTRHSMDYYSEMEKMSAKERQVYRKMIKIDHLKAPSMDGLVIPVYQGKEIIAFQQRIINKADNKKVYISLSFKKSELLKKEREIKSMPRLTHVDALVDPSYVYCNGAQPAFDRNEKVLYITEGALKAEVVNYYFKRECVAGLSAKSFADPEFKEFIKKYKGYKIVVCPDKDYKYNYGVASGYLQLLDFLFAEDFNFSVLTWSHPEEIINNSLKGVDDAIICQNEDSKVGFYEVSPEAFFFNMDDQLRKKYIQSKGITAVKPGALLTESMVDALSYKIVKEDQKLINDPDMVYDPADRVSVFQEQLAKHKFCIDLSATGSGKSHGAGLLRVDALSKAFVQERVWKNHKKIGKQFNMFGDNEAKSDEEKELDRLVKANTVKCIKYVSQSPMNSTVQSLEGHRVIMGRNAKGWIYDTYLDKWRKAEENEEAIYQPNCPQAEDVILLSQNRQILSIQKDICEKCPLKNSCLYLEEAEKSRNVPYQKLSIQSLKVNEGDFIILDDPGSIEFFRSIGITEDDITKLIDMLSIKGKWKRHSVGIQTLLNLVFGEIKKGKTLTAIRDELDKAGKLKQFQIGEWLSLPEPDKIPMARVRVRHDIGLEMEGKYREFKNLKRWFFMFLEVLRANQNGDIFYDFKNSQWVIKSVDPKFHDMLEKSAGVLLLDATANKEYYKNIFGEEPFLMSAEGDPFKNVKVTRVEGFNNTYSSYLKYGDRIDELKGKIEWVNRKHEELGKASGVLTFSEVIKSPDFKPLWNADLQKGYWFCDERASNIFYLNNCTNMFLIGVPNPNIASVAADSGGLIRDEGTCFVARPYGLQTASGEKVFIISKESADKTIRNAVAFKKDSAYIQALGRLRSLQRPNETLNLFILEKTSLPFDVQETITVDETKKREVISSSTDSVNIRVKYYNHIIEEVKSVQKDNGDELDMKGFRMLSSRVDDKSLFKLGISAYNCRTCSDIIRIVEEVRDRFVLNPSTFINYSKAGLSLDDITPEEKARQIKQGLSSVK